MSKTEELEKIAENCDESQKLGEFIGWLRSEQEIELCVYDGECGEEDHAIYFPINLTVEQLLARFFGVDLKKAEEERQDLLDEIRKDQG